MLIQDFFYTKTESGKLIQNIVFEYADTSLEKVIEKHHSKNLPISERIIKVVYYLFRAIFIRF